MEEETAQTIKHDSIRRQWDDQNHKWYFSIVDIIDVTTLSSDPRNYWKFFKNRLKNSQKKGQNELVSKCNQLKMRASDGKFYLTDVADEKIILEIIKLVSPENVSSFEQYFSNLEHPKNSYQGEPLVCSFLEEKTYPQSDMDEANFMLMVDGYRTNDSLIVKAFIAGVNLKNISIFATRNSLTIEGTRFSARQDLVESYLQELYWGKFSRTIDLPNEIKTKEIEVEENSGLLTIKLPLVDKNIPKKIMRMRTI